MQRLSEFLSESIGIELWMASLVAIALMTIVVNQVAQMALKRAARLTEQTANVWDDALVGSAARPVLAALWVIGLGFMARVLQKQFDTEFLAEALLVRDVALIACVASFLWRFAGRVGRNIELRHRERGEEIDHTTIDAMVKLARLVTVVVAVITAAHTFGFEVAGLLALGGVGGIAVGFAAKDLLANFFGGLTIYLDRPFGVGDWIRSPDKEIEGVVEKVNWRHTRVRALNKNPIYVPNSLFTNVVVENVTRMSHRRLRAVIGLRYDDFAKVEAIGNDIRALLEGHEHIDQGQSVVVGFTEYGASSLNILVNAFSPLTSLADFQPVRQQILLEIGRIVERHGAEFAFPTQTLYLQGAGETGPAQADRAGDA